MVTSLDRVHPKRCRRLLVAFVLGISLRLVWANWTIHATFYWKQSILSPNLKNSSQNESAAAVDDSPLSLPLHDSKNQVPRNLRLAFIGDSLTRYMYLSLAHFLRWGYWEKDEDFPSMVQKRQYGSWDAFFNFTKSKLAPYEQCDCWRNRAGQYSGYENRYYWYPVRNNSVTMILKQGSHAVVGHFNNTNLHLQHDLDVDFNKDFAWNYYDDWADIITHHLGKIPHKPQYVIFNAGLWPNNGLEGEEQQDFVLDALKENNFIGIYKTTTFNREHKVGRYSSHDEELCINTHYCLNVSWTEQIDSNSYWDKNHFYSSVYNQMNLQLLDMLPRIESITVNSK